MNINDFNVVNQVVILYFILYDLPAAFNEIDHYL